MKMLIIATAALAAGSWLAPAAAQNIYRCGDGTYSRKPCPGGLLVHVSAEKPQLTRPKKPQSEHFTAVSPAKPGGEARSKKKKAD
jgi:hypothetical protein